MCACAAALTLASARCSADRSMHTAARMYNAAKEGSSLLTEGGKAAAEIKRSAARHSASLGAAIGLAKVTDNFKSVASQFEVNKPDFLATHNFLRETKRAYLQGCAAQSAEQATDRSVEAALLEEQRKRAAVEAQLQQQQAEVVTAREVVAREVAARAEAERREAEALAAAVVREADWQRATERVAAQRDVAEQLPSGCRVCDRALTLFMVVACGCRVALRGVQLLAVC